MKDDAGELRARDVRERILLAALFAGAFAMRVWGVSKMHTWDENV